MHESGCNCDRFIGIGNKEENNWFLLRGEGQGGYSRRTSVHGNAVQVLAAEVVKTGDSDGNRQNGFPNISGAGSAFPPSLSSSIH